MPDKKKSKWISGKELIDKHGLKETEILDKIEFDGWQPYDKYGKPVRCPTGHHKISSLKHDLRCIESDMEVVRDPKNSRRKEKLLSGESDPESVIKNFQDEKNEIEAQIDDIEKNDDFYDSWEYFKRPGFDDSLNDIFSEIPSYLFKVSDVEKHFNLKTGESSKKIEKNDTQDRTVIYNGDAWIINYDGNKAYLRDLPRVRYIWRLLESPNKNFSHLDLQTLVSGKQSEPDKYYKNMSSEQLEEEGFTDNLEDIMVENLSEDEIERLQKIAYDQWDDLMQKKPDAENNWEKTRKHLFNEYGIKVIPKKNGPKFKISKRLKEDAEKARVNVTNNIRNALKDLKEKMPSLYEHLKNRIITGGTCRYETESTESKQWHIKWNK